MMFDSLIVSAQFKHHERVKFSDYKKWQKLFSFDALRGKKYGKSFCDYFDILDYRIYYEQDWTNCDRIIKSDWLVRA